MYYTYTLVPPEKKYLIFEIWTKIVVNKKYCLVTKNIMRLFQCFEQVLLEILQFYQITEMLRGKY